MTSSHSSRSLPRLALAALAVATFAAGAAEMVAIGLQHDLAGRLGVTVSAAGLLVSVYAASVALGGPVLTALVARVAPGRSIPVLLVCFGAAQALAALAPSLGWLLAARVPAGVLMGALFAIGTVAATQAAPEGREGSALGVLTLGLTASLVAGAPLGSALAGLAGWRACFWTIAAIAILAAAGVALTAGRLGPGSPAARGDQIAAIKRPAVRLALARTTLVVPAVFAPTPTSRPC